MYVGKGKRKLSILGRLVAKGALHMVVDPDLGGGGGNDDAAAAAAAAAEAEAAALAAAELEKNKGGGPTDAEAKLIKEVMDKKAKIKTLSDSQAALAAQLKEFEGIDPAAVRALLAEQKANEEKKLEDKGEWDRLKGSMKTEHQKELDAERAAKAAIADENSGLKSTIANLTVGNAFMSSALIKDDLTIPASKVRALYASHFEFVDGEIVAYDKPAGSKDRTQLVDGSGDALSFEVALKKIIDADPDKDDLYKSKAKQGAGSKTVDKAKTPDKSLEQPRGVNAIADGLAKLKAKK